jgi:hypothetical protein
MGNKNHKYKIINKNISLVEEYINKNHEEWNKIDFSWIYPYPTTYNNLNWDRLECHQEVFDGQTFDVYERDTGTQPTKVFYYWNGNKVRGNIEYVLNFITTKVGLTHNWTPIFTLGKFIHKTDRGDYIWYQRYEPTQPFVDARNLIGIYNIKRFKQEELPEDLKAHEVVLISLRSVPPDILPIKIPKNEPQIIWHGAYLLISDGEYTRVHKFDSEDEGGWLFQPLTNFAFPKYVQEEAVLTTKYIRDHYDDKLTI